MRILVVTVSLPQGPSETFVLPELAELVREGHDVLVVPVLPRGPVIHEDARALLEHCLVRPLVDAGIALKALMMLIRRPAAFLRVLGILTRSRDWRVGLKNLAVVPKGLWLGAIARQHQVDHIHAYWLSTPATLAMVAAAVSDLPWSCTGYRWDIGENNLLAEKARYAQFIRVADRAGAEEAAASIGAELPGPVVIYSGVDLPSLTSPARERSHPSLRLLMPAHFVEKKGHRYMIQAVAELKRRGISVQCDLAGGGPLEASIRDAVAAEALGDSVRLLGVVPHLTFQQRLERGDWDVVVMPSIETADGEKEGIPVSLVEAMARGVPVISTTTGGIPELLADGAGVLIPPADPTALADAIAAFAASIELQEGYAKRGRKRIEESFAVTSVVKNLVDRMQGRSVDACEPPTGVFARRAKD